MISKFGFTFLSFALILLCSVGSARQAQNFHELSLYFGAVPTAYWPNPEAVEAHAFAICELDRHLVREESLPKAGFRGPQRVAAAFAPEGYSLQTSFYNSQGEEVEKLTQVGAYGARITVSYKGRDYTFWRHLYRLPKGSPEPEDTSERAALEHLAEDKLHRSWRATDPALFTYAMQWRQDWGLARGTYEPLEWFALFPPDYSEETAQSYPALLYLHGSGGTRFTLEQLKADPFYESFETLTDRGCIVVVPQSPRAWQAPPVMNLLDRVLAELPIDPDRLVIAGHSMGGSGVWRVLEGSGAPERFAGAAMVSGGGVPPLWRTPRYTTLPLWLVYGEDEDIEGREANAAMAKAINEAGGKAAYLDLPEANHMQSRNRFFADTAFFDWVLNPGR